MSQPCMGGMRELAREGDSLAGGETGGERHEVLICHREVPCRVSRGTQAHRHPQTGTNDINNNLNNNVTFESYHGEHPRLGDPL